MLPSLKQFGISLGFFLLGMLLLLNALVTRHRIEVQAATAEWVMHTKQTLVEMEQTESTLKDAETGQRGYLLTGDPKYLAPYNRAKAEIATRVDDLARLTSDNPAEQKNVADLRTLAREKLDELAQTIALYQAGNTEQARALVLSDKGLLLMDQLRLVFASMVQEETRLDVERSAAYRHEVRMTEASLWLATLAAVLGLMVLAYSTFRQQSLREKHARELRAGEELYRTTLTSIGDAVIATNRLGFVTFLNPVAERLTGFSVADAAGRSITEVFPIFNEVTGKRAEDPVRKVMDLGTVVGLANHTVLKSRNGASVPIEDSAAPIRDDKNELIGVVLVFRDVTAERKSEEVLRKTEKLAAAARLSATVAHEINNPLAAVVNLIYIAKNTPDTPPTVVQNLVHAEQELDRVAHITRQALAFYRESSAPEPVEISGLMDSVLKLYSNKLAAKDIKVVCELSRCEPIRGILGELRQAVSNLIANAIDAVERNGTITITGRMVSIGEDRMVEIAVADDGPGIAAEHIDRIFEPFFTTKKDVGTGLGLWATKTIVERHGGTIAVRAAQNGNGSRGTAFAIQLPCIAADAEGAALSQPA